MRNNFESALEHVLVHEGGFADHPDDPGGATMKGVTLAVYRRYYGANKTKDDLRDITEEQLAHIYKTGYWDKCKCDALPSGVDYAVFDSAVNSGPGRAAKWLQGTIGAVQDGGIGPNTLYMVESHHPDKIIDDMLDRRLAFLQSLRIWSTFGRGWRRRVEGVRKTALKMVGANVAAQPVTSPEDYEIVHRGSSGKWVIQLQIALDIPVDGDFGAGTEAALKAFQMENGLEPDGIAGRNTYRALGLIS